MDIISYVDFLSISTIKAHVILLFLSITIVSLPYAISFYHLLHIRPLLTVLTNMLCYTSLCTIMYKVAYFPLLVESFFLSLLYPPY